MRAFAWILALTGCAKTAHDLSPFPCADDLTCPSGLACVDTTCQPAVIDAICTVGSDPTDCSTAAPGARCSKQSDSLDIGACELPCSSGCASGRTCSTTSNDGVCLVDCTNNGTPCPPNTLCLPREDGRKVCTPPSIGCRTVTNIKRCTARLCTARASAVTCPNGAATCPASSTCSADSRRCTCEDNREAIACNDMPCDSTCGGTLQWWCAPNIATATCFTDLVDVQGTCECWKGSIAVDCDQSGVTCDELCREL